MRRAGLWGFGGGGEGSGRVRGWPRSFTLIHYFVIVGFVDHQ